MIIYEPGPTPPVITALGDTVTCPSSIGYSYQWFFNGNPILGATDSFYVAHTTGTYSVRVTDSLGCNALSNGVYVLITSVNELRVDSRQLIVYPNPVTDQLCIYNYQLLTVNCQLSVYNVLGERVFSRQFATLNPSFGGLSTINNQQSTVLDVSHLAKGVYLIQLTTEDEVFRTKLIKN